MKKSKALFIGGTGTISSAIVKELSQRPDWEVWLLNRGNRGGELPENVTILCGDVNDEEKTAELLRNLSF